MMHFYYYVFISLWPRAQRLLSFFPTMAGFFTRRGISINKQFLLHSELSNSINKAFQMKDRRYEKVEELLKWQLGSHSINFSCAAFIEDRAL